MWVVFALGSAIFASLTSILAKVGMKNIDSDFATALRTVIVLIFAWLIVFITGENSGISDISIKSYVFLIMSGIATGGSWLCYFKALQLGNVNKVVAIDKSSVILTMILAFIFLGENIGIYKVIGMIFIGSGTYLTIEMRKNENNNEKNIWVMYALLSAVFASLTSILAKVGIENVSSNLATAIRTIVVLFMAWVMVFVKDKNMKIKDISKKDIIFILLSGLATGMSWLCYYRALQEGQASVVVPIDKLSIVFTVIFSYAFLKEKVSKNFIIGLISIVVGTLVLLL